MDQPIILLLYPLCYATVFLKFTYYAQYYAQKQESLSDYSAFYMQFGMRISLHVAEKFYKDYFIRVY